MNSAEVLSTAISVIVPSAVTLIGCLINNNLQQEKEKSEIKMEIASVNANYDKSTALIQAQINELSERVNKHNNLIERMYKCEDRLNIVEHDIADIRKDVDDGK